jgi:hypothetical protein
MPEAGCRRIADSFNRRFAAKRRITVGKTFVFEFLRKQRYEVEVLRRQIRFSSSQVMFLLVPLVSCVHPVWLPLAS